METILQDYFNNTCPSSSNEHEHTIEQVLGLQDELDGKELISNKTEAQNDLSSTDKYWSIKGVVDYFNSKIITEDLFCIARLPLNGTTWEFIEDENHQKSSNIQSITSNPASGFNFSITHNSGFTKVGSVVATVDETYATFGLKIGGSIGKTESLFRITRDGFTVRASVSSGVFSFANDTGQLVLPSDFSYTLDSVTGNFVISHPNMVCTYGDTAIISPYNTNITTRLISKTPTSVTFQFYNNGVLMTSISSLMRIYYTRTGTFQCTNEQIGNNNANFWIKGIFYK